MLKPNEIYIVIETKTESVLNPYFSRYNHGIEPQYVTKPGTRTYKYKTEESFLKHVSDPMKQGEREVFIARAVGVIQKVTYSIVDA